MTDKSKQLGIYLLERYGVPMCLLFGVLWFVGMRIVDPLMQTHIQFVNSTATAVQTVTQVERGQVAALEQLTLLVREQGRYLEEIRDSVGRPGGRNKPNSSPSHEP
jgi:hypothetical protein